MSFYDFTAVKMNGQTIPLSDYQGKVVLVVNTASKCGFTPQFAGLESLYEAYREKGFEILGFPTNQFGKGDVKANDAIEEFCQLNYGVSFPMFEKSEVNGSNALPLYQFLKAEAPGALGKAIKWNFTKFLIDREGRVIKRFAPATEPKDLISEIEKYL